MQIIHTGFEGLVELIPTVFPDNRGWFFEFYKTDVFKQSGITHNFTQENVSYSKKGVIRGLHFQLAPHAQAKLVSVLSGSVLDVVVDIRTGSSTFGKVYTCILDGAKHNLLMVPEGFAHGFAALQDSIFMYKTTGSYQRESECGIRWNDPTLNITWPFSDPILSPKDSELPLFDQLLGNSVISRD
jgi:dTDP-4-dehydrorhamnose 3,5-epimerase